MMEALIVIEAIVIGLLVVLVAGLLRSHAEILRQLHALGGGEHQTESPVRSPRRAGLGPSPLANLSGPTPEGGTASVALAGSRGYSLLAFLSTTCTSCQPFWQGLSGDLNFSGARPILVTRDPSEERPREIARLASGKVTTVMSSQAWDAFEVPATPYFALIDNANAAVVGEGSAANWGRVGEMVSRALSDHGHPLHRSTSARKADVDEELREAGIEPGDQRLYQPPAT
jgi:hypothetical protein